MLKVALVCIAKNEDNYIEEWLKYNLKLGFDEIFIYQNDWRWSGNMEKVNKIEFDGPIRQVEAYNNFITNNKDKFDWVAFFDIDEFLVLKIHKDIKYFINDYADLPAIGINWVLFGDNGYTKVIDDYSLLRRFTKRQKSTNLHVKNIINLSKTNSMNIHNPNSEWYDTNRNQQFGSFLNPGLDNIAQINHYFCKTKEEFIHKIKKGRADAKSIRKIEEFDKHNFNEIVDMSAYNFYFNS